MTDTPEEDFGGFTHDPEEEVPVEQWVPWPVSDSSDYLGRPSPVYQDEGSDDGATT